VVHPNSGCSHFAHLSLEPVERCYGGKVYNLAELIDFAERNNPETSTFFTSKLCEIAALKSLRNKWESKNEQ
jgi:hypothetical protein